MKTGTKFKGFTVKVNARRYEFLPCAWLDSTSFGFRWYAVVKHHSTGMYLAEQHSPRFATKQACREWAKEREEMDAYLAGEFLA